MNDAREHGTVTVESDGVTVSKWFDDEEFPVPAIVFAFDSHREVPVRVRLSEPVPDGVAVADLGFHPDYGSEHWGIDDDEITFEREFAPEEQYTTVYGIRATGTDDVERFLAEPTIVEVDPAPGGADASGRDGSPAAASTARVKPDSGPDIADEEPVETPRPGIDTGEVVPDSGSERPVTARGYKGPKWLVDRLPRIGRPDE